MAQIRKEIIAVQLSRLVRDDAVQDDQVMITREMLELIDATLQEVLELPNGVVIEVGRAED
jgi:hypothetical protein